MSEGITAELPNLLELVPPGLLRGLGYGEARRGVYDHVTIMIGCHGSYMIEKLPIIRG